MLSKKLPPLLLLLICTGCGVYSFSGATLNPDLKTFIVTDIRLAASTAPPSLALLFGEALKNKILSETRLNLKNNKPDAEFKGTVLTYQVEPTASGANDRAQLNKLSIAIRIDYNNQITKEKWSQTFKQFETFDRNANLSDVETQLISSINERLVQEIFNKAFVNW